MDNKDFYLQSTVTRFTEEVSAERPLPEKIGPYKIESILSSGGMSLLYLGKDPESGALLAIKVLSPKYISNQVMIDQFLKEAEIIALTDHPNIIKLFGQGEWENGLYIAMEFIQGISLRQFIVQHSLSLKRSLDVILQVSYALLHLHTHGVIHRDLKPENILITESGQVKVIDFGIAQVTAEPAKGGEGHFVGTPSYMSPEQKFNPAQASYASDIFSLGVIAYELILGKLSFGHVQLNLLPKNLRPIISKALKSNPDERFNDIVDFITEISLYLKSNSRNADSSSEDELKEVYEQLGQSLKTLLPIEVPKWADIDVGMARVQGGFAFGVFYDFVRLPNRDAIIFMAETTSEEIDSAVYIAYLKGLIRMSLHEIMTSAKKFNLTEFITKLNQKLADDSSPATYRMSTLHIDMTLEQFSFLSCGFHGVWHYSLGAHAPRVIMNHHQPLGKDRNAEFFETQDNFYQGDSIAMHSFNEDRLSKEEHQLIEDEAKKIIQDAHDLSTASCADLLFKKLSEIAPSLVNKSQKLTIVAQRID
ncbi:MAG: protein kinase [Simkaniaceae bacterium]|nr:protein kinase [Simkaniaceae bacterium]